MHLFSNEKVPIFSSWSIVGCSHCNVTCMSVLHAARFAGIRRKEKRKEKSKLRSRGDLMPLTTRGPISLSQRFRGGKINSVQSWSEILCTEISRTLLVQAENKATLTGMKFVVMIPPLDIATHPSRADCYPEERFPPQLLPNNRIHTDLSFERSIALSSFFRGGKSCCVRPAGALRDGWMDRAKAGRKLSLFLTSVRHFLGFKRSFVAGDASSLDREKWEKKLKIRN